MSLNRPLSSLELTALGIVLKRGPCRAHAVLKEFAGSMTFAYRSGAGSIYPLLSRLAEAGLLHVDDRLYSLTTSGVQALKDWIRPPFGDADFSTKFDSLRARSYFLKLLSTSEVEEYLDAALAGCEALLAECNRTLAEQRDSGDRFGELAQLGAVLETEARIAWLKQFRSGLKSV